MNRVLDFKETCSKEKICSKECKYYEWCKNVFNFKVKPTDYENDEDLLRIVKYFKISRRN